MRWGRGHFEGPQPPLHAQFSKDVLVSIYSAYVDNFLNAKDAVRVAKEARPAFLKFLEVPRPGRGRRPPSPRTGQPRGPAPGRCLLCMLLLTRGPARPLLGFQQSMRENKEKQALSDLMIKPVQRIPRYELLVKVGKAWRHAGGAGGL